MTTTMMMDPYYSGAASSSTPGPASASASAVNAAAARPQSQLQSQSIIVPACTAVLAAVHQASADVTNFVRRCRPARADLAPVTRELSELQMVLQLLGDCDAAPGLLPDELQSHLRPILANCAAVVQRISGVLVMQQQQQQQQRPGDSVAAPLHWTVTARDEVDELAGSLEAHRGVVGLVSDLAAVLVSRGAACGWGDEQQQQQQQIQVAVILEELRVLGSSIRISYSGAALARENFALQVHLGQIVAYAETLARTEVWEDAVRTLDEAQKTAATTTPGAASVRASIPATAPLRRRPSAAAAADDRDAYVPDTGLENLLHMGSPDKYDPNRPPSMFFSPNRTPEPGGGGGAPATGFIVMDGFINSDPSSYMGAPARFPAHEQIGAYDTRGAGLGDGPETDLRLVSEKALGRGYSAERIVTTAAATPSDLTPRASRVTRAPRPLTAGLEVVMPPEKEMATGEGNEAEVTEEALAFAQVPVHILGRLSVNLVGQLYSNNPGGSSDKTSFNQSLSTIKTEEEEDEDEDERDADGDGVASTSTSDTGSLRDGRLQFSQLGSPKLPPPMMNSHSWSTSQTPSGSQPRPSTESLFLTQSYPQETTDNDDAEDDSSVMRPRPPPPRPSRSSHDAESSSSSHLKPDSQVSSASVSRGGGHGRGVRQMQSTSTMNTETFRMQKPLPKAPIVYIPGYPGPFIKKKAVVVGNFSCGKTCLITRMSRGHFPRGKADKCSITETVKLSVDEEPMELALWDIRGIDYDPTWLNDAHVALVCFSVNIGSTDSKGKHLGRWVAEVNRNCPGAAILLVGLKADIRFHARSVEKLRRGGKALVTPEQGEQFRENIGASRYLECSARTGEGVLEVLGETARVAMHIRNGDNWKKSGGGGGGRRPLSRIGRFFGLSSSGGQ